MRTATKKIRQSLLVLSAITVLSSLANAQATSQKVTPEIRTKQTWAIGVVWGVEPEGGKSCAPGKECWWTLTVEQGGTSEWNLQTQEKPVLVKGDCVRVVATMSDSGQRWMTKEEVAAHLPLLVRYEKVDDCDVTKANLASSPRAPAAASHPLPPQSPTRPVKGTTYRGLYLGQLLTSVDLRATNCFYDTDKVFAAILSQHRQQACLLISEDGRTLTRFVEFEVGPSNSVYSSLVARFGSPIPEQCHLIDETLWTCWKAKDGTWIATKRNSGRDARQGGPLVHWSQTVFLKTE